MKKSALSFNFCRINDDDEPTSESTSRPGNLIFPVVLLSYQAHLQNPKGHKRVLINLHIIRECHSGYKSKYAIHGRMWKVRLFVCAPSSYLIRPRNGHILPLEFLFCLMMIYTNFTCLKKTQFPLYFASYFMHIYAHFTTS